MIKAIEVRVQWLRWGVWVIVIWLAVIALRVGQIADHLTHDCYVCNPPEEVHR